MKSNNTVCVCGKFRPEKIPLRARAQPTGKLLTTGFPPGGHVFGLRLRTNSAGSRSAPLQSSIAERGGGNVRTTPVPILLSAGRLCRHKLLCRLVQLAMREVKGNGYLPKKGANPLHPSSSR